MNCAPSHTASTAESSNVAKRNVHLDCGALAEHLTVEFMLARRRKKEEEARAAAGQKIKRRAAVEAERKRLADEKKRKIAEVQAVRMKLADEKKRKIAERDAATIKRIEEKRRKEKGKTAKRPRFMEDGSGFKRQKAMVTTDAAAKPTAGPKTTSEGAVVQIEATDCGEKLAEGGLEGK